MGRFGASVLTRLFGTKTTTTFREYRDAPTAWERAARVCIGLAFIFAVVRWYRG